jgi:Fe(3+) dicitrate transport protein
LVLVLLFVSKNQNMAGKACFIPLVVLLSPVFGQGQSAPADTLADKNVREITVSAVRLSDQKIDRLPEVHKTYVLAGKKTEVIQVAGLNANLAEKTGRQVFARVPGVFVYDMDGSGNQVNISTRGLDPHRSWEFNIRHNGILANSDMYGYPASHFSAPMESIEKVEIVRGGGALQYGAQFGGLVNYVTKSPDTARAIGFENQTTVGSFGLFSSFNAVGGKKGNVSYYAYYHKRVSDGYRRNSRSEAEGHFAQLSWQAAPTLRLRAELAHSRYLYRIPGPLTDSMFRADPRQSTRTRNYFSPDIYIPSVSLHWEPSAGTRLSWTTSAVLGARNSVQVEGFATAADGPDPTTGEYRPRQVDIDRFNSYTSELRLLHRHRLGGLEHSLAAGAQFMHNDLHRRQLGRGTTGSDYDLTLTDPVWGRDLHFKTVNTALFLENMIALGPRLALSPGLRMELGESRMSGHLAYYDPAGIPAAVRHRFPLLGISGRYFLDGETQAYGGWTQAYRPVIFKDIIPGSVLERANPDILDARGHTSELGIRGATPGRRLRFDVSGFYLVYRNRPGNLVVEDPPTGQSYVYKTNIGDSRTYGLEAFAEARLILRRQFTLSVFTASSWFHARYATGEVAVGAENRSVAGNTVESVPDWISRNGLHLAYRRFALSALYSYVGETFSDALNKAEPTVNGAKGLVPAYGIADLNASYRINDRFTLRAGVNNLADRQYFTKRPAGYPGPGVWSSDGRNVQASLNMKL